MRATLKRAVEGSLVRSGVAAAALRRRSGDVAILAYHNIVPRGERPVGERALHLDQADFAEHLDRVLETHRIVGLDELVLDDAPSDRPRAVLTFDDAYLGAMTAGVEELARRDLVATVFVNPGAIEWPGFWWDRLAEPGGGAMDEAVREHALGVLGGSQQAIMSWANEQGLPTAPLPDFARPAPIPTLRAVSGAVVRFGSHTWSHARLPSLSGAPLREELERPISWLRERFERVSDWIAYPYGHHSAGVTSAAAELYAGGLRVSGGLTVLPVQDRMAVPRINISRGTSPNGLVLRLSGLR